jgi:hypothetical protein
VPLSGRNWESEATHRHSISVYEMDPEVGKTGATLVTLMLGRANEHNVHQRFELQNVASYKGTF